MKENLKNIGRALGYGGVYLGGQITGGIIASMGLGIYSGIKCRMEGITDREVIVQRYMDTYQSVTGIIVVLAAIITISFLAVFFAIRKEKMSEKINAVKSNPQNILLSAGLGFMMYFAIVGILINLPISEEMMQSYTSASTGLFTQNFAIAVLSNIIAAPIIEEIIFRGLIFDRLKKAMPVIPAMVISSVLFGLAHGQIIWICYATAVGLVLAFIYHKTRSIIPCMTAHMVLNGTSTLINYSGLSLSATFFTVAAVAALIVMTVLIVMMIKKNASEPRMAEVKVATAA